MGDQVNVRWPDAVDDILGGDQVVALASVTPASGVVVAPVTNFALRDSRSGTVTVNSSVGAWKKVQRIRQNPHVALAFHTRTHGFSDRPEYVLIQGRAMVSAPIPDYPSSISGNWERFGDPPATNPLWRWWLRVYYLRVRIDVEVERVTAWPDLVCRDIAQTYGEAMPSRPGPSQRPPSHGTGPRVDHVRLARVTSHLPHVLLGWVGADQFPVVTPVDIAGTSDSGILLRAAHRLLPEGRRRAGLAAHAFTRHVLGQHQRLATGWLEFEPTQDLAVYAPHTSFGYRMPPSKLLYRSAVGLATRTGLRRAHRAGVYPEAPLLSSIGGGDARRSRWPRP
jgi:hypothetical protein